MSSRDKEREQQELETTTMLKTMIIESGDDDDTSILEELEEFEEKIEYLDIPEEKKNKLQELCNEIKKEDNESTREYLFKLLQKEAK